MNTLCQKLAITISPPFRDMYKNFAQPNRFLFFDDRIQIESIFKYNKIGRYIIYPELDPKGRLHYHGIVTLSHNERVRFHKHAIHKLKLIGFVDIKPLAKLKDNLKWIIYIKKEWGFTSALLEIDQPIMKQNNKTQKLNKRLNDELDKGIMQYLING